MKVAVHYYNTNADIITDESTVALSSVSAGIIYYISEPPVWGH